MPASLRQLLGPIEADLRGAPPRSALPALADILYRHAVTRAAGFSLPPVADPAWLLLLALYGADARGERLSLSALCRTAAVPVTTAFRCILRLEDLALVERVPDPRDRRRAWVGLSARGRDALTGQLVALHADIARILFE
ncbi:MarR family transcriptional regulator [Sphingomonas oligophenolica]|uniref:MarR family transcriptional regulator n=1 Tax=Sphingomonas oligophenolica TaxID=301154 RepID=A0ABU9Y3H7_9SPHN